MADNDAVEPRVQRLEDDMTRLRPQVARAVHDAAAARVLAGGADRDVSEMRTMMRAHTQALNALRETQVEQFADVNAQLTEIRQGLGTVHVGMAQITALLTILTDDE